MIDIGSSPITSTNLFNEFRSLFKRLLVEICYGDNRFPSEEFLADHHGQQATPFSGSCLHGRHRKTDSRRSGQSIGSDTSGDC